MIQQTLEHIYGLSSGFKALLYPPICLFCQNPIDSHKWRQFCQTCSQHFERVDPSHRCPSCFAEACQTCHTRPRLTRRTLAAFDYEENARRLLDVFKAGNRSYLAEGMGALMALQWLEQGMPFPDLIIPVPSSPLKTFQRSYNPSLLLAHTVSKLLKRPLWRGLQKELTYLSQSDKSDPDRLKLPPNNIFLSKDPSPLRDKHLLLIDDILVSGQTLHLSASRLLEGYPRTIDALVFAR